MRNFKKKDIEQFIKGIIALRDNASDEAAAAAPSLFPSLKRDGKSMKAGKRIKMDGEVYCLLEDADDTDNNSPKNAPDKWKKIKKERKENE